MKNLENAKKMEEYANTILGFCSDGANTTIDVAIIMALSTAKMFKSFDECVDDDNNISDPLAKAEIKNEFRNKFLHFVKCFQTQLDILSKLQELGDEDED